MHELGVVFHCIKEIKKVAEENKVKEIDKVVIRLGEVSLVIPHLFEDCYKWAIKKEPVLMNSKLEIEIIKAITHCESCHKDYETVKYAKVCPYCKSENTYLLQGNEVEIKEIQVKDN